MQDYIEQRVLEISRYMLDTSATVREVAKVFGVSKSTVHKDLTERLPQINSFIARDVRHVLQKNKEERHLRGGEATRQKYKALKKKLEKDQQSGTGYREISVE